MPDGTPCRVLLSMAGALLALASACSLAGTVHYAENAWTGAAWRTGNPDPASLSSRGREGSRELLLADEIVEAAFVVRTGRIEVDLRNAGERPFSILFKEARHVAPDGRERKLFIRRRPWRGTPSGRLDPGARVSFVAWPEEWIRRDLKGRPVGTYDGDSPLGGSTVTEDGPEAARARGLSDAGRSFSLVLPLRVGDERVEYRFEFTARDVVRVERTVWA